jgi:glycosyltransferase involved in cell wall biosynthesis
VLERIVPGKLFVKGNAVRVVYVDTGMVNEIGHHATSCRLITRALRDHGHAVTVAGWTGLDPLLRSEFNAQPVFRHNTYSRIGGDPICGWLSDYFVAAQLTAEDLRSLGPFAADDLLYVNSVQPAQLQAVCTFLGGLPEAARPQTVVELGTDPGVEFAAGLDGGVTFTARDARVDPRATLYRFTGRLRQTLNLPQLNLVTFNSTSSSVYALLLGTQVGTLPLPHVAAVPPRQRGGDGPRTISILGHQRGEKGYHLVPEIARLLLAASGDVRLLVHNAQPDGMVEIQKAMRALAAADLRVELDERPAGPEIWRALLERSDVIVCPYVTDHFRAAYSALASEAVACAIPLVVPAYTTLDQLVQAFDAGGVSFDRLEPVAVVEAVQRLLADFDKHAASALVAARRWAETMGADQMVETMLARLAAVAMQARAPDRVAA